MARPRINKNWLFLGLAAVLGIGAVVLSNSLLKRHMQELDAQAHRGQQTVRVIVASHDLARGQSLTSKDLAVRAVPREWVHSTALKPADFDSVQNQRLATPLKRGETLLQSHLEGKGSTVFSANLKKGWRALTFEVDTVNSISGMLRPGDRIDLIYTGKPPQVANAAPGVAEEDNVTLPLLSDVTVLATGQTITKHDAQGHPHDFSAITLEVSPLDADRVIVAKDGGHLTALLRHPEDDGRNDTQSMSKATLVAGAAKGGAAASGPFVEYIVGGNGGGLAKTTTVADLATGGGNAH